LYLPLLFRINKGYHILQEQSGNELDVSNIATSFPRQARFPAPKVRSLLFTRARRAGNASWLSYFFRIHLSGLKEAAS
jgi:hypothetical protein